MSEPLPTKIGKVDKAKLKPIYERNRERGLIIGELKKRGPLTIAELSEATRLQVGKVLKHIIALRQLGRITTAGERDNEFVYALSK